MQRRAACLALLCAGGTATATDLPALPQGLRERLAGATLCGSGRLRFLGLAMYEARLWAGAGFRREAYDAQPLVLELHYLRAFNRNDIARRSIEEMARQPDVPRAALAGWEQRLREAIPSVARDDRIAGVHLPGVGASFVTRGQVHGQIDDPAFSRHFFGIWLSPHTSEPALRAALLAGAPGS